MNLRHSFSIDSDDPFKNDRLKREPEAHTLTHLVRNYSDGFVLAINNEWGGGKTTFVKMWQAHMEKEGFKTLYYNAWENDYQEDVLVSMLAELQELKGASAEKRKFKSVLKYAGQLSTKTAVGAAKGLAKSLGVDGVVEGALTGLAEGTEKVLGDEIQAYLQRKDGLKKFRESLEKYVDAIGDGNPVVFIIDELDRCRPSYAVEVLERVKHIFSVPGIVFVLAMDKVQLGHAIKGVYGSPGMDDVEYLRRFIDVEFSLPRPKISDFVDYLVEYYQIYQDDRENRNPTDYRGIHFAFQEFSKSFNLNLRQVERVFAHLKLLIATNGIHPQIHAFVYVFLIIMRVKENKVYSQMIIGEMDESDLIGHLNAWVPRNLFENYGGLAMVQILTSYNNLRRKRKPGLPQLIADDATDQNAKTTFRFGHLLGTPQQTVTSIREYMVSRLGRINFAYIAAPIELTDKYFEL